MIVLVTPKGWTGPAAVDGIAVEGTQRSHQVPLSDMARPGHLRALEDWMRSYRPAELFDGNGSLREEIARIVAVVTQGRQVVFIYHAQVRTSCDEQKAYLEVVI
jgi:hypothetical protein